MHTWGRFTIRWIALRRLRIDACRNLTRRWDGLGSYPCFPLLCVLTSGRQETRLNATQCLASLCEPAFTLYTTRTPTHSRTHTNVDGDGWMLKLNQRFELGGTAVVFIVHTKSLKFWCLSWVFQANYGTQLKTSTILCSVNLVVIAQGSWKSSTTP